MKKVKKFFVSVYSFVNQNWRKPMFWLYCGLIIAFLVFLIVNVVISNVPKSYSASITANGNQTISTYESYDEAENNPNTLKDVKKLKIHVDSWEKINLHPSDGSITRTDNTFEMDIQGSGRISFTLELGGDGLITTRYLSDEVKKLYFTIDIENPSEEPQNIPNNEDEDEDEDEEDDEVKVNKTNTEPTATVYIGKGDQKFILPIYGSSKEAQEEISKQKDSYTIPEWETVELSANPQNATHVNITIVKLDDEKTELTGTTLWRKNDFSSTLNVEQYSGKQVTLCLQFVNEDKFLFGYKYVSFFVP